MTDCLFHACFRSRLIQFLGVGCARLIFVLHKLWVPSRHRSSPHDRTAGLGLAQSRLGPLAKASTSFHQMRTGNSG
jgi:hypothetical protein